jgi:hypothetical protein
VRLSAWRTAAPHKAAATAKVAAVVDPVLSALGAEPDPHCWVVWGDEPAVRYSILVPTDAGLIHAFVRVNIAGEGPRTTTKLVRWNRISVGELSLETQSGHRLLTFQVDGQVLRGVDVEADQVAAFALRIIAAVDGRPLPPPEESRSRRGAERRTSADAGGRTAGRDAGRRVATTATAATTAPSAIRATGSSTGPRARPATGR